MVDCGSDVEGLGVDSYQLHYEHHRSCIGGLYLVSLGERIIIQAKRYAIMICLDGKDDWIFVTEKTSDCWDLRPMLFADLEEAVEHSKTFIIEGKEENVTVIEFE